MGFYSAPWQEDGYNLWKGEEEKEQQQQQKNIHLQSQNDPSIDSLHTQIIIHFGGE